MSSSGVRSCSTPSAARPLTVPSRPGPRACAPLAVGGASRGTSGRSGTSRSSPRARRAEPSPTPSPPSTSPPTSPSSRPRTSGRSRITSKVFSMPIRNRVSGSRSNTCRDRGDHRRGDVLGGALDDLGVQRALARKVVVQDGLRDAGGARDVLHAGVAMPAAPELHGRGLDDHLAALLGLQAPARPAQRSLTCHPAYRPAGW